MQKGTKAGCQLPVARSKEYFGRAFSCPESADGATARRHESRNGEINCQILA
jgi:hypothetical protein